jgi:hypothetical protein
VSEADLADFVQSRDYVELVTTLAFEYDPAAPLASEPERCILTTAQTHDIQADVAAAAVLEEGY